VKIKLYLAAFAPLVGVGAGLPFAGGNWAPALVAGTFALVSAAWVIWLSGQAPGVAAGSNAEVEAEGHDPGGGLPAAAEAGRRWEAARVQAEQVVLKVRPPLCGYSAQATRMAGMAGAIERLSTSSAEVAENIGTMETTVDGADLFATEGVKVVRETTIAIGSVSSAIDEVAKSIALLGEHSQKISGLANTVKGIADQTNLLALNAAIEAARAGEQGRGFAVVADEVRKLAEHTASATQQISATVSVIQSGTCDAVVRMQEASESAGRCNQYAHQAEDTLNRISGGVQEVKSMAHAIAGAARAQHAAIGELTSDVGHMATVAVASDSCKDGVDELEKLLGLLEGYVKQSGEYLERP
jgi:hypothetical protein